MVGEKHREYHPYAYYICTLEILYGHVNLEIEDDLNRPPTHLLIRWDQASQSVHQKDPIRWVFRGKAKSTSDIGADRATVFFQKNKL